MRVWLNLDRMRAYNVSAEDVMKALAEQSMIGSPGRLGQATGKTSQTDRVRPDLGRALQQAGAVREHHPARPIPKGEILRLKDVAKVELGSSFFDIYSDIDGHPSAAIVLKQTPGSNAAEVIEEVKEKLEEIKEESFPPGMDYEISYDVSSFLDASIEKVLHTLLEAFVLVSLVVYLFLGDLRSTLIPTLAVPVSLIGTFFFMQLFGLSINLITLFALVLAIGVVVDDAIVVVEAVHAKMHEKHLSPYRGDQEVVHEISGAIIAITLVMTAVFVPVTFMTGPVGVFYRQFGITMAMSIVLSGVVALTLTPVLCAMILKPHDPHKKKSVSPLAMLLRLVRPRRREGHRRLCRDRAADRHAAPADACWSSRGFGVGIFVVNTVLPAGFIPREDQGIIYGIIQTPPGSTLEYTNAKSHELQEICKELDEVTSVSSLAGYEVLTEGRGSNAGTCLINLKPWAERKLTSKQIIEELEEKGRKIANVKLEFFEPPAVPGFGAAGGFSAAPARQDEQRRLRAARRSDRQVHGGLGEAQGAEGPLHLLRQQLPAVRARHRQRRGHAEGRVDRRGDGQPLHRRRQHLGAGLRPLRPVLQGLRPGRAGVPAVSRGPGEHVRQERRGGNGPLLGVHEDQEEAGPERDHPLQPVSLRRHSRRAGGGLQQRSGHRRRSRKSPPRRCRAATTSAGKASRTTRRTRGTRRSTSS